MVEAQEINQEAKPQLSLEQQITSVLLNKMSCFSFINKTPLVMLHIRKEFFHLFEVLTGSFDRLNIYYSLNERSDPRNPSNEYYVVNVRFGKNPKTAQLISDNFLIIDSGKKQALDKMIVGQAEKEALKEEKAAKPKEKPKSKLDKVIDLNNKILEQNSQLIKENQELKVLWANLDKETEPDERAS